VVTEEQKKDLYEAGSTRILETIDQGFLYMEGMMIIPNYIVIGGLLGYFLPQEIIESKKYKNAKVIILDDRTDCNTLTIGDENYGWSLVRAQVLERHFFYWV